MTVNPSPIRKGIDPLTFGDGDVPVARKIVHLILALAVDAGKVPTPTRQLQCAFTRGTCRKIARLAFEKKQQRVFRRECRNSIRLQIEPGGSFLREAGVLNRCAGTFHKRGSATANERKSAVPSPCRDGCIRHLNGVDIRNGCNNDIDRAAFGMAWRRRKRKKSCSDETHELLFFFHVLLPISKFRLKRVAADSSRLTALSLPLSERMAPDDCSLRKDVRSESHQQSHRRPDSKPHGLAQSKARAPQGAE